MEWHRDPVFLLNDVAHIYARRFEERARGLSLTLAQCRALAVVADCESVDQKRLSDIGEIDPMRLARVLDRMEVLGWAERRSPPRDRGAPSLAMTESAQAVLRSILLVINDTHADALKGMTNDELETLMELLGRVHANLSTDPTLAIEPAYSKMNSAVASARSVR